MKTSPSAGFTTHIGQTSTTLCFLIRIQRVDGTVFGFTNLDKDILFNDGQGAVIYRHAPGVGRTAITSTADLAVDNTEFQAFFESMGITKADIRDGLWDFAQVKVYLINYDNLSQGALKIRRGFLGEATSATLFASEIRGMMQKYVNEIVELTSPLCRADLGDSRCKIDLLGTTWTATTDYSSKVRVPFDAGGLTPESVIKPTTPNDRWFMVTVGGTTGGSEPTWNTTLGGSTSDGSVTYETIRARRVSPVVATVVNQMEFTITLTTDAPDEFFQGGFIEFTSGNNAIGGISKRGIAKWILSTKSILLYQPCARLIQVGDNLNMISGCDHIRDSDCTLTYDNVFNFRGEPDMPGNDQVFRIPDAPVG